MTTIDTLATTARTRAPSATVLLNGKPWRAILKLSKSQQFGSSIATGTIEGRSPPVTPAVGMSISWTWGYNSYHRPGFTGEVADIVDKSYPDTWVLQVKDVLYRADQSQQVIATSPLNDIAASTAVEQILTDYGGVAASRLSIPELSASGSEWGGSEWILGTLTPVQWGDTDSGTGGTTALRAAQEICGVLGYWLYADAAGIVRAKQMERRPSTSAMRTYRRGVDLLLQGSPERQQNVDAVYNQVTVLGANTGVDGAQITDQYQTSHPLLRSGVYRNKDFSSFLIEYVNAAEAGNASANSVARRLINVHSRIPNVVRYRAKADPRLSVGATVGIVDSGIGYSAPQYFFLYQLDTTLDCRTGAFDDQLTLDGGTGSQGYTTIPNPDASFSWRLATEGLDGDAVTEVFLDGSGSLSLADGAIVSWAWESNTATYGSTPDTATGVRAVFIYPAATATAEIVLTVTDTTSKIGVLTQTIDLTGADTIPPIQRTISAAAGAAWYVTTDGGVNWNIETSNGDAIAVGTYGAGIDDRAAGTGATYGLLATRGAGGAGGLRQTLDGLATPSTNLVSNAAAITSNIWVNEANPARVWFAIDDTLYRSTDGGATKTAMAKPSAGTDITWVIEDPAVDNSVFVACGADLYNATNPTSGWALLYEGPSGATARQFVRSRDGQVTWVCYTGTFTGGAAQRVETGAEADIANAEVRTLALDREASANAATLYLVTGDDPAEIWTVDGLTGLDAVQSGETFPAGATVQHVLADPEIDVLYAADFDSVASGQGALRKYLIQPDLLMLWKELASGEQGHMLGFGSPGAATADILILPYGAAGAADKIWRYSSTAGTWAGITPPAAGYYWRWLAANPFDTSKWLLLGNSGTTGNADFYQATGGVMKTQNGTHSPLWYTEDAGATWQQISLATPNGNGSADQTRAIPRVEWSAADGSKWYACRLDITEGTTVTLWRGTGTTAAAPVTDTTTTSGQHIIPGLDEDVYFTPAAASGNRRAAYFDSANTFHDPSGTALGVNVPFGDRYPLTRAVLMTGLDGTLFGASDYRAAQPTQIGGAGVGGFSVAIVGDNAYVGSTGGGVLEVIDPFGADTRATVFAVAQAVGVIRSDRQTHTHCAVQVIPSGTPTAVGIFNGTAWATLTLPPDADPAALYDYVEVLVSE